MTEDEARDWLRLTFGNAAYARLELYVRMLLAEAKKQSLISRSTFGSVWARHIVDSAQLLALGTPDGLWIDIGSGGGLPGIVVAILREGPVRLVEPRRRRATFLQELCDLLALRNAEVIHSNVQAIDGRADVISARAVAPLNDIFTWTTHIVSRETRYLLPRGHNAGDDLAIARRAWQGRFHVEQSLTEPSAGIVVANDVAAQ